MEENAPRLTAAVTSDWERTVKLNSPQWHANEYSTVLLRDILLVQPISVLVASDLSIPLSYQIPSPRASGLTDSVERQVCQLASSVDAKCCLRDAPESLNTIYVYKVITDTGDL